MIPTAMPEIPMADPNKPMRIISTAIYRRGFMEVIIVISDDGGYKAEEVNAEISNIATLIITKLTLFLDFNETNIEIEP